MIAPDNIVGCLRKNLNKNVPIENYILQRLVRPIDLLDEFKKNPNLVMTNGIITVSIWNQPVKIDGEILILSNLLDELNKYYRNSNKVPN